MVSTRGIFEENDWRMSSVSLTVRESTVNVSDCMGGEGDIVGGDEVVNILLELVALVDVSVVDKENEEDSVVSCVVEVVDAVVSVVVVSVSVSVVVVVVFVVVEFNSV
eukprot:CAMPEP_0168590426 /NCGR_PEP_ID=MMETSP0420-20121227/6562_1 /TAXON_ID=498008 /ORGANISM="Pessonella sp." /LENGTH=107 /DNA_ID=CAMNT_0008626085 /DNA_START=397 /DNA_END=720 /DNA_ORIENTATION=+